MGLKGEGAAEKEKESLVLLGRGMVWAKGEEKNVRLAEQCKILPSCTSVFLLHICSPPAAITFHLISQLKSPPWTPLCLLEAFSLQDLKGAASLTSSQFHFFLFPWPPLAISERDYQKGLPRPSSLSNPFPNALPGRPFQKQIWFYHSFPNHLSWAPDHLQLGSPTPGLQTFLCITAWVLPPCQISSNIRFSKEHEPYCGELRMWGIQAAFLWESS